MGVGICCCGSANSCNVTWPKVLSYNGNVGQSQSGFYFINTTTSPAPYTLTYGPRPSDVPQQLQMEYFNVPGGINPPYYTTVADNAWWSPAIPSLVFGNATNVYFYLWMKGCSAVVMVIDSPYSHTSGGTPITEGAGNNQKTYIATRLGSLGGLSFQMAASPFAVVAIEGTHGSDDVVPDSQGGAGYPTAVRSGP